MTAESVTAAARLRAWCAEAAAVVAAGIDLALPRTCPGCHRAGSWCATCAATITGRPRAVTLPSAAMDRLAGAGVPAPSIHALSRYRNPVRDAIVAGKERGRRDLPPLLGQALGAGLEILQDHSVLPPELWLIPAPTRRAAARARGGDPVLTMARSAAAHLAGHGRATGVAPCLTLVRSTRDSVGLDAAARAVNLAGAIRFDHRAAPPAGSSVVFVDDVLTSGATVTSSVTALAARHYVVTGVLVLAAVPALQPIVLPYRPGPGADTNQRCGADPGAASSANK